MVPQEVCGISPETPFSWVVWDGHNDCPPYPHCTASQNTAFSDEVVHPTFEAAFAAMIDARTTNPIRAAIIESRNFDEKGPRSKIYRYFNPQKGWVSDGSLGLTRRDIMARYVTIGGLVLIGLTAIVLMTVFLLGGFQ